MTQYFRSIKPMDVVGLLFGLIVDLRWFPGMRIFEGVAWNSIGWWLFAIFILLSVFTSLSVVLLVVIESMVSKSGRPVVYRGMGAAEGAGWYFLGAVVHYLSTLAFWHDAESLLLAWLHLLFFLIHLLHRKTKQVLRSTDES